MLVEEFSEQAADRVDEAELAVVVGVSVKGLTVPWVTTDSIQRLGDAMEQRFPNSFMRPDVFFGVRCAMGINVRRVTDF